jgi:CRISPR-associated protein Cas1
MKKHLNTLFVTTQGAYLSEEGETVVVKVEGEIRIRVPLHTIGGIVCFGNVSCSPYLMGFCAENDVGLSFFNRTWSLPRQGPGPGFGKCSSPQGTIPAGG